MVAQLAEQQAIRERDASARRAARVAQPVEQQVVKERDAFAKHAARAAQPADQRQAAKRRARAWQAEPCTLWMRWKGWWYTHWVPCHIGAHTVMHFALNMKKSASLCVAAVARCLG